MFKLLYSRINIALANRLICLIKLVIECLIMKSDRNLNLVADIGGTNARFALVDHSNPELIDARNLVCADYDSIVDAIRAYLQDVSAALPARAAISIASAVTGDQLVMTNHVWQFSASATRRALGLDSIKLLNDYTALALALPFIDGNQCLKVGGGELYAGHARAAIGPGTGLGVSGLISVGDSWYPLESEGGHVTYGPATERESEIFSLIRPRFKHISAESIVSGPGLSLLYEVITQLETGVSKYLMPHEVTDLAVKNSCVMAREALSIFCGALGTVAGNLALTLGARGGVYLGGGILRKMTGFFIDSSFRERFEQHGRMTTYLSQIPTYLIDMEFPALIGAMVSLNEEYESIGVVSRRDI